MRRPHHLFFWLAALALSLCVGACEGPRERTGAPPGASLPASQSGASGASAAEPAALAGPHDPTTAGSRCERLEQERGALNLGTPLRARVDAFPSAARAWLERESPPRPAVDALERLLVQPTAVDALAALHAHASAFEAHPRLLVDATLATLTAVRPREGDTNANVLELLARARAWLPGEPSLPWIEALLVPERGGRRALLAEAFAAGERDPALVFALARAAMRDGDSRTTLDLLGSMPSAPASADAVSGTAAVGVALSELALATEAARAAMRSTEQGGIRAWAPPSLPAAVLDALAQAVRSDLNEASALLGGPARPELVVWVHPSLDDLRAATCGASWSQALYDGVLHVVLAGPPLDAALRQSVRHEALHAQLDWLAPLAPRWLQEGLAQRFAREPVVSPAEGAYVNEQDDLAAIEAALRPGVTGARAGAAYAAARRVVDGMVAEGGERALAAAVEALRRGLSPASVVADPTAPPT